MGPPRRVDCQVFIDPTTGQITEPTAAQLEELNQQRQANVSFEPSEVVERPGPGGGMMIEVPTSFFPLLTAAIGIDGKVTLKERPAQAGTKAIPHRPKVEQSRRSAPGQRHDPSGDAGQSLRSEADQRLGPSGDYQSLPFPETADVTVTIVNGDAAGEGFNDPTASGASVRQPWNHAGSSATERVPRGRPSIGARSSSQLSPS